MWLTRRCPEFSRRPRGRALAASGTSGSVHLALTCLTSEFRGGGHRELPANCPLSMFPAQQSMDSEWERGGIPSLWLNLRFPPASNEKLLAGNIWD